MNFKEDIDRAYKDLNLIPINGQEYAVDKILTEFFINNKKSVILSADTGTGKSIIGAVIAKIFNYKFKDQNEEDEMCNATVTVHSNSLVKQYGQTFNDFPSEEFHQIIGASNYTCEAAKYELSNNLKDAKQSFTGEDCYKKKADDITKKRFCNNCEYNIAKSYINRTETLITNYSYHFISSMWSRHLSPRRIVIFDEAHTINDVFCEHNSILISAERLNGYIDECKKHYPIETREYVNTMNVIRDKILREEIDESRYVEAIKTLMIAYKGINRIFAAGAEKANLDDYLKLFKIGKKYHDLGCKIGDLIAYEYDHVFESKDDEISIKPIFVGEMSKVIMGEYNLFMSATISDAFMKTTLSLSSEDTAFVKLDPVYSPDNKQIMFCGAGRLNFAEMKKPETIQNLKDIVKEVVENANEDDYKGLMLTPSFAVAEMLSKAVPKQTKIFLHKPGEKIDKIIKEFKAYKGKSILISPSIYEGLDFADDLSRYQIIVKAPYPSLGEKRMAHIANKYPEIYRIMTLMKIVQGIGRSCRNKDDYCITFILDSNAESLFKSPLNVWRNQFTIL